VGLFSKAKKTTKLKEAFTNLKTKCEIQSNQNVSNLHLLVQIKM